jgi:TolB-like protein/class 3 adenylate cyclase/Tfp pilus assembly protein PilF
MPFYDPWGGRNPLARDQRRLAAILAADVVGYSRLMGQDESATLQRLREHRTERLQPALARYGGRLVKLTGDGALIEFSSAVDALSAAIEFQQAMVEANRDQLEETRIVFRIGLHSGDLIVDGDDLYGDGINVAARLEGEAPPGGIVISRTVHEAVAGRLKATFDDLGSLALKNIERPVQAFGVKWNAVDWQASEPPAIAPSGVAPAEAMPPPLPDKPSIAVLPFQNLSGDPEQEYFADGMVEEIITALSRNKQLFVIARNSTFAYKGKSPDIRQVGRELGVRYVLEGSVRKAGNRVRITGQLIDAATGVHIWADRFDGDLEDIFQLQDQMTSSVIGGILPTLDLAEMERAKHKTENLQAYDYYLRSRAAENRYYTAETSLDALVNARKSVELDPEFALGHAQLVRAILVRWSFRFTVDHAAEAAEAEQAIRRALELDSNDAWVLAACGQTLFIVLRRPKEGAAHLTQAVKLNPNLSIAWTYLASVRIALDEPLAAIGDLERAMRLSPVDTLRYFQVMLMARAHNLCGNYEQALAFAAEALRLRSNYPNTMIEQVVANALAGRIDVARELMTKYRAIQPNDRVSSYSSSNLSASSILKYREALRVAGLPE